MHEAGLDHQSKKKNQNKTIKDILATIIETLDSRYYHGVVMVLKIFLTLGDTCSNV